MLKLRFGEEQMQTCEVMLKDFADSKRIRAWVSEELEKVAKNQPSEKQQDNQEDSENLVAKLIQSLFFLIINNILRWLMSEWTYLG